VYSDKLFSVCIASSIIALDHTAVTALKYLWLLLLEVLDQCVPQGIALLNLTNIFLALIQEGIGIRHIYYMLDILFTFCVIVLYTKGVTVLKLDREE